jgi:hypothetical protein
MITWREELHRVLAGNGESFDDIISNTMSEEEMDREFSDDWGCIEGSPFTVWTRERVYFPVCYDGSEWISWVSRNPDGKPTNHVGGG